MSIKTTEATSSTQRSRVRRRRMTLPSLRLRASERKLLLFLMDVLIVNGALLIALSLGTEREWTDLLAPYKWYVTLTLVWLVSALFFDVYDLARAASTFNSIRSSGAAALVTLLIYTLIPALTPPLQNRTPIYLFAVLAVLGITAWRLAYAQFFVQPWFKQRALVVGAGWAGRTLAQALQLAPEDANPYRGTGYDLVGFVDDDPSYAGTIVEGIPVQAD